MKRHKWEWQGSYRRPLVMERDFFRAAPGEPWQWKRSTIRNAACGACGLWKRAKVHR